MMVAFVIFLYGIYYGITTFAVKLYRKDKESIKFLKHFAIYFAIMLVFLAIIWPGHWVWDEMFVIDYTQEYKVFMWQSVLTQIYYGIALLIFPSVISIVILQIILISLVIAYIQTKIEAIYKNKWYNIILYILFLLPAVITNNLYILRLPMYSYSMLLFFAILLFDYISKKEINLNKAFLLYILSSIMILWRSEGIIFLVFIPIMLALTYPRLRNTLKIIAICAVLILSYMGFNKIFEENEDKSYGLLVYVNPLSNMLQEDLNVDEEDIAKINKVMDIEKIKANPSYTETPAYWAGELFTKDYEENLDGLTSAYAKIVLKNPISFIRARLKTFIATSGMDKDVIPQVSNRFLYNLSGVEPNEYVNEFCAKNSYMNTIFKSLKLNVESFLNGENAITKQQNQFVKILFWNFIPVLILVLIIGIKNIISKKWLIVFMCITLLAKAGVVFLTAPASYFMYYFPEYIIGFLIISVEIFEKRRKKDNVRITKEK